MQSVDKVVEKFKKSGLKITSQRIAIFNLLKDARNHPSAEDVYRKILEIYPTTSFTTVYKTLKTLLDLGEIQELTIDSKRIHYDPDTSEHIHTLCEHCGALADLHWSDFIMNNARFYGFEKANFEVHRVQVYLIGLCRKCRMKKWGLHK